MATQHPAALWAGNLKAGRVGAMGAIFDTGRKVMTPEGAGVVRAYVIGGSETSVPPASPPRDPLHTVMVNGVKREFPASQLRYL